MPAGLDQGLVRCPLCLEQYVLGEALDQLPPTLIVLDGSTAGEEPELAGAGVTAGLVEAEAGGEYRIAGGGFEAALDSRPGVGATRFAGTAGREGPAAQAEGKKRPARNHQGGRGRSGGLRSRVFS